MLSQVRRPVGLGRPIGPNQTGMLPEHAPGAHRFARWAAGPPLRLGRGDRFAIPPSELPGGVSIHAAMLPRYARGRDRAGGPGLCRWARQACGRREQSGDPRTCAVRPRGSSEKSSTMRGGAMCALGGDLLWISLTRPTADRIVPGTARSSSRARSGPFVARCRSTPPWETTSRSSSRRGKPFPPLAAGSRSAGGPFFVERNPTVDHRTEHGCQEGGSRRWVEETSSSRLAPRRRLRPAGGARAAAADVGLSR